MLSPSDRSQGRADRKWGMRERGRQTKIPPPAWFKSGSLQLPTPLSLQRPMTLKPNSQRIHRSLFMPFQHLYRLKRRKKPSGHMASEDVFSPPFCGAVRACPCSNYPRVTPLRSRTAAVHSGSDVIIDVFVESRLQLPRWNSACGHITIRHVDARRRAEREREREVELQLKAWLNLLP